MRAGPSKVLDVLEPDTATPAQLRGILGRSGLYVRPKGSLTDMGISEDVTMKPTPKKNVSPRRSLQTGLSQLSKHLKTLVVGVLRPCNI